MKRHTYSDMRRHAQASGLGWIESRLFAMTFVLLGAMAGANVITIKD